MHRHVAGLSSRGRRLRLAVGNAVPLEIFERRAILVFVGAAVIAGVVVAALDGFRRPGALLLEIFLSLAFLIALWNVAAVPVVLLFLVTGSSLIDGGQQAMLALAVSGALVARCCTRVVQMLFIIVFLACVMIMYSSVESSSATASLVVLVLVAAGSGMLGVLIRTQVIQRALARTALNVEQQRSARIVQDERRRIADDLHDIVAHDLTAIAMHAQLLARTDDEEDRKRSQESILAASRQALNDLRRVVNATSGDDRVGALPGYDFADAIASTGHELAAAGYDVHSDTDGISDRTISRLHVSAIERVLREASTNIVKHAPAPQQVSIIARHTEGVLRLRVWNSLRTSSRKNRQLPGGGYGTLRMQERTELLGGAFSAGRDGDGWLLEVVLPEA